MMKVYMIITISSAMNVLMKFVIYITLSFAFSFSKYDDMHSVLGCMRRGDVAMDRGKGVSIGEKIREKYDRCSSFLTPLTAKPSSKFFTIFEVQPTTSSHLDPPVTQKSPSTMMPTLQTILTLRSQYPATHSCSTEDASLGVHTSKRPSHSRLLKPNIFLLFMPPRPSHGFKHSSKNLVSFPTSRPIFVSIASVPSLSSTSMTQ